MSRSRVQQPDTAVLKISDGDTLTVKRRLNHGERRALFARIYTAGVDGRVRTNPFNEGVYVVAAYLLDWTLINPDGTRLDISGKTIDELVSVVDSLEEDSFKEIKAAVEAHENAMEAERIAEKKLRGGGKNAAEISPSPDAATGPSNTSGA